MSTPRDRAEQDILNHNGRNPGGGQAYLEAYDDLIYEREQAARDAREEAAAEERCEIVAYLRDNVGDLLRDIRQEHGRAATEDEIEEAVQAALLQAVRR